MDRQEALSAYIQAVIPEREEYLYQRALAKARPITKNMKPEEKQEYIESKAFSNAVFRQQRADKVLQAMRRGELVHEFHQTEFERLAPLIMAGCRQEEPVDLKFLRSVERSRQPLSKVRAVLRLLQERAPGKLLEDRRKALADQTEKYVAESLLRDDLSRLVSREEPVERIVPHLLAMEFKRGIPDGMIERAWRPKPLTAVLKEEIRRKLPQLASCGGIQTGRGVTVAEAVDGEIGQARLDLCAETRKRFPAPRIRKLLMDNPSIRRLQKQADAALAGEKRLRSALIRAIPAHYRDLYPLARQMRRRFVLHLGPTNSGKTYDGVGHLKAARQGIYLGPLRLLAAEQYDLLNREGIPCSLVTGEEQILIPGSRVQSSTVEMADLRAHYDVAVIDECQLIGDRNRGGAWTAAILGLCADEIHACASPDAEGLLTRIIGECGDELTIVRHQRMTPLVAQKEGFTFPASVRRGDALIVFSKARVHAVAAELRRMGFHVALIYGALPPDVRGAQAERFRQGDAEVVVSTDAIAMGLNLPIERVVFLESEKYDGDITRPLTDAEIKQIAGRAGRYGQYETGYVNAYGFKGIVAQALNKRLPPLTEAIISFPESLLGIPLPLTQIINQWISMKDKGCFSKASTARMEALSAMMETPRTDKTLLYRFLCMPFDETEPDLLARWRNMYYAECGHRHVDVLAEIPELINPEECVAPMLDGLEADYRRCDLYYNYARVFLEEPDYILNEIQWRKSLISQGIIRILSTQKLQQKTCASCNRTLPWNWPYRLCDDCYRRQRPARKKRSSPGAERY